MRDRKSQWTLVFFLLAGAVAILLRNYRPEPSYQGRTLSRWLEDCDLNKAALGLSATVAVQHMGKDAVPALVGMLRERDSPLKRRLMGNGLEFRSLGFRITAAACRQMRAAAACQVLGSDAESAIPALIELSDRAVVGQGAANALAAIGPKAMTSLVAELTNRTALHRAGAAIALRQFGTNATSAIPALAMAMEDSDSKVRRSTVETLGAVGTDGGDVVVAALTRALGDDDPLVRRCGLAFLGSLGPKAKESAPVVEKLLTDADPEVRRLVPIVTRAMQAGATSEHRPHAGAESR